MREPVALVAEAWADLAASSEGDQALAAWEVAVSGLPLAHPWRVLAVEALLRAALAGTYSAQKALFYAEGLTESGDDRWQTARFLEAQVAAREGDSDRVRAVVGMLLPHADEPRRRKLDSLLSSLAQPSLLNPGDTPDERGSRR